MFLEEVTNRLINQNVGQYATSITLGSQGRIPVGDGPLLELRDTGGTDSSRTHNDTATPRPSAQVLARGKNPVDVRRCIWAAHTALGGPDGLYNITLDNIFYLSLVAKQEPTDIGLDGVGRVMYSFNVDAEKQRS